MLNTLLAIISQELTGVQRKHDIIRKVMGGTKWTRAMRQLAKKYVDYDVFPLPFKMLRGENE